MSQIAPFNALNELHRELSRVFNDRQSADNSSIFSSATWAPQVDIKESEECFTVLADVPGVNPDDVEVTLHNGLLTIKGEKRSDSESEDGAFKRVERVRGSFFRQFTLPDSVNDDAIQARSSNGVLEIIIPKSAKAKPLNIEVKAH